MGILEHNQVWIFHGVHLAAILFYHKLLFSLVCAHVIFNNLFMVWFLSSYSFGVDRALKTRGNTPKYGLIFHSSFIGRASARNKGRMARYLANKCSIASRIDCFSGKFCCWNEMKHIFYCWVVLCFFMCSFFMLIYLTDDGNQRRIPLFLGKSCVSRWRRDWSSMTKVLPLERILMWWNLPLTMCSRSPYNLEMVWCFCIIL